MQGLKKHQHHMIQEVETFDETYLVCFMKYIELASGKIGLTFLSNTFL